MIKTSRAAYMPNLLSNISIVTVTSNQYNVVNSIGNTKTYNCRLKINILIHFQISDFHYFEISDFPFIIN